MYDHDNFDKLSEIVFSNSMGSLYFKFVYLRYDFDYHPGEVYWCTADIGWITGHSYITYGPMANGATSIMVSSLCITSQSLVMGNTTVIQTTVHGKSLEINILNELGKFSEMLMS